MHAASPRAAEKGVGCIQAEQFGPLPPKICSAISMANTTASLYSMAASIEIERLYPWFDAKWPILLFCSRMAAFLSDHISPNVYKCLTIYIVRGWLFRPSAVINCHGQRRVTTRLASS